MLPRNSELDHRTANRRSRIGPSLDDGNRRSPTRTTSTRFVFCAVMLAGVLGTTCSGEKQAAVIVRTEPTFATLQPGQSFELSLELEPGSYGRLYVAAQASAGLPATTLLATFAGPSGSVDADRTPRHEEPARALLWRGGVGRELCWTRSSASAALNWTATVRTQSTLDRPTRIEFRWSEVRELEAEDGRRCALLRRLAEAETQLHHDHEPASLGELREIARAAEDAGLDSAAGSAWLEVSHATAMFATAEATADAARRAAAAFEKAGMNQERFDALNTVATADLRNSQTPDLLRTVAAGQRRLGNSFGEVSALNNLGLSYMQRADPSPAFAAYLDAYDRAVETDQPRQQAFALHNTAELYLLLGDHVRAIEFAERALDMHLEQVDPGPAAHVLDHLGDAYAGLGEPQVAAGFYTRALELNRTLPGDWGIARSLEKLASLLASQDQDERALELYEEAVGIWERVDHQEGRAKALAGAASVHTAKGDLTRADELHRQALSILGADGLEAVPALAGLARLDQLTGNVEGAIDKLRRAIELIEASRDRVADEALRAHYLSTKRHYYDYLLELFSDRPSPDRIATAFAASERAKARSWADVLRRAGVYNPIPPELEQRAATNRQRVSQLLAEQAVLATKTAATEQPQAVDELAHLRTEWDLIRQQIRSHELGAAVPIAQPVAIGSVRTALRREEARSALLSYHLGRDAGWVFLLRGEDERLVQISGQRELAPLIEEFRRLQSTPQRRNWNRLVQVGSVLFEKLLAPLGSELDGIEQLVIAPDGPLAALPFSALVMDVTRGQPRFAVQQWSFRMVPSATTWLLLQERTRPRSSLGSLLAVASDDLPAAEQEITAIADFYSEAELLRGPDATEERVRASDLGRVDTVHLAVHAEANSSRPSESALLLERTGDDPLTDGRWTAGELARLTLDARLVVLSACGSALGDPVHGEGYLGLTRSILLAGADQVVASLWRVADESTAELMIAFHRERLATPTAAENSSSSSSSARALSRAQRSLLEGDFAHPYYWAPFILNG